MAEVIPLPRAEPVHPTDTGNAQRLVARHGADLRYCHPWSRWLVWEGRRWAEDDTGEVDRRLKETLRALLADTGEIADDKERAKMMRHVLDSERSARHSGALQMARSDLPVTPAELDTDPWSLNVANGTLDLRYGELRAHDRAELQTKLAAVEFDAGAGCARWLDFLERVFAGDAELIQFVQRAVGYSLTGNTGEQVFFLLHGGGANGKTTFVETLRSLLGDYGSQTPAETFMERRDTIPNDIARLRGVRFLAAVESSEGRRLNESLVKRLTGGDTITARFMRSEFFEFQPAFKAWVATNHRPEIRGTDEAIWRRVRLIPFAVTIPEAERDRDLPAILREELPGILNWALEGCLGWQFEGLPQPAAVRAATASYREEQDELGDFLADRCVVEKGARATSGALYDEYTSWAEEAGIRTKLTAKQLSLRLKDRGEGFEQTRTRASRWWIGLRLASEGTL